MAKTTWIPYILLGLVSTLVEVHADPKLPGCVYNGIYYEQGVEFPATDECNNCRCTVFGTVSCTNVTCCLYHGTVYQPGARFDAIGSCNTCWCMDDIIVMVGCTEQYCPNCLYDGIIYQPGDTFNATDGCNTCSCTENGEIPCTEMYCGMPELA
ncbi:hypothetical protein SNE40_012477 [Patella caerulea]|uniref:VWFC domain-containing protein n=1 Tax=Patella caerulea TaxID=87958 RepID=A0AAN8JNY4_PATCE